MKKDITVPEVSGIEFAVVYEHNDIYNTDDWNAYIINTKETPISIVIVVSKGFSDKKITSTMRKKIDVLPAKSYAKVELLQPELFALTNQFQVSFFENNQLLEKTFTFKAKSIKEGALRMIPLLQKKGILAS